MASTPIPFAFTSVALSSRSKMVRPLTFREMDLLLYSQRFGNYLNDITFGSSSLSGNDIFVDFLRVDSNTLASCDMTVDSNLFHVICTLSSRSRLDDIAESFGLNFSLDFKVASGVFSIVTTDLDTSDNIIVDFSYRTDSTNGDYIFGAKISNSIANDIHFSGGCLFSALHTSRVIPILYDCTLETTLIP